MTLEGRKNFSIMTNKHKSQKKIFNFTKIKNFCLAEYTGMGKIISFQLGEDMFNTYYLQRINM